MKTSAAGLAFIEANEGTSLIVYNDVVGKPTIGCGHLLQPGESYPNGITQDECDALLAADVAHVENALNSLIPADCTQNQFDACVDFGFNLGVGSLKTMLGHGWESIPEQILRWDRAGGQQVAGLTRRRQAEVALFNS